MQGSIYEPSRQGQQRVKSDICCAQRFFLEGYPDGVSWELLHLGYTCEKCKCARQHAQLRTRFDTSSM